jgi:hypothetical protein
MRLKTKTIRCTVDIKEFVANYTDWLKQEITVENYGGYYEFTVPFLDRFNDYLQFYVKLNDDGSIFLTDAGYTFANLPWTEKPFKRKETLKDKVRGYSLDMDNYGAIIGSATKPDFPFKKNMMVQAMIAVDNMFT